MIKDYFKDLNEDEGAYIAIGKCGNCNIFSKYYIMRYNELFVIINTAQTFCNPQRIYFLTSEKNKKQRVKEYKTKNAANKWLSTHIEQTTNKNN